MRRPIAPVAIAAAMLVAALAANSPANSQDFSITNQVAPVSAGRRDVMRQLQAWWDVHAYYPRHASNAEEAGTVKIHLVILPDGRIQSVAVVDSSRSRALDTAGVAAFNGGFVRPLPDGSANVELDLPLHFVLTHRRDQSTPAGYAPGPSNSPFTITNDPVKSPTLTMLLQRTCTGSVVKQGIRNHPAYGVRSEAQAIFFRKPDGTPWVRFYEGGYPILSPVTEIGKLLQWTGREEHSNRGQNRYGSTMSQYFQYTVWPDGENKLAGSLITDAANDADNINHGGTVDFTCATETVPPLAWSAWSVTPGNRPPDDPP